MECIIANQVTRLSLTFNLHAVNIPPANLCLFKPRPAQPPQPWRSAVKLHLIFDKWLSTECPFIVSFAGWNYDLLGIILIIIFIVKLGPTVERTRSLNLIKHLLILVPGSLKTCKLSFTRETRKKQNITQAEFSKCGVSPWGVIGLCLACFGYPPGPLQIAGHVASVTFSMRRCRWGAVLLEKHGEAEGGHVGL